MRSLKKISWWKLRHIFNWILFHMKSDNCEREISKKDIFVASFLIESAEDRDLVSWRARRIEASWKTQRDLDCMMKRRLFTRLQWLIVAQEFMICCETRNWGSTIDVLWRMSERTEAENERYLVNRLAASNVQFPSRSFTSPETSLFDFHRTRSIDISLLQVAFCFRGARLSSLMWIFFSFTYPRPR